MDEKRVHPRITIQLDVICEIADRGPVTGHSKDLSVGGMFVVASEALAFNTQITIVTKLTELGEVRLPAVVRWSTAEGFGVQFGLLGARETHALSNMMRI
jgi:c-di-GMP-binding flagellar brake protein YcgR